MNDNSPAPGKWSMWGLLLRRWPVVLVVLLVVGLLSLGGVIFLGADDGGGDVPSGALATPPVPGEEFDGCKVVTRDDAEGVLGGVPRRGPKSSVQFTAANCTWESIPGGGARNLQFSAYRGHELYGGDLLKDAPTYEKVEGVGDGAFSLEPEGSVQLQLLAGDYFVLLSVNGLDVGPALDRKAVKGHLVDLGKRVVSKLD